MNDTPKTSSALLPREGHGHTAYKTYLKPYVDKLLASIGLDIDYFRGYGDRLFYVDSDGNEQAVLDMVGGFGAGLFGHNHPELVACAQAVLATQRPMLSQASARGYAGLLAERLAILVEQITGRAYRVTLANSGTEAVEAALKHAEMSRRERAQDFLATQHRTFRLIRSRLHDATLSIAEAFLHTSARQLGAVEIGDLDALEFHLTEHNRRQLFGDRFFVAVEGSFHGKSSGSVKLTHSPDFRNPWHDMGIQTKFVPRNDKDALLRMSADAVAMCYAIVLGDDGTISLKEAIWSRIVGCFAEPIQGEGGIHMLSPEFMCALHAMAKHAVAPLILDEIQSGMGRTGTFLASSTTGVIADYYLLSKALGGGLAKQAALLIRKDHYLDEFGYLHTSTFAEDDFSAALGLAALELVMRDGGALMENCRTKGEYLLTRLRALQQEYPQVIREVRGCGLMIGIELVPQTESVSNLLRVASEQSLLGFLFSGYLLHEAGIRIAPTLSANQTIRLEPSAFVSKSDLDCFCDAFSVGIAAIARGDAYHLTRHMTVRNRVQTVITSPTSAPVMCARRPPIHTSAPMRRVACVAHFIEPQDLLHWDPTLGSLSEVECSHLLAKAGTVLDPFLVDECVIEGPWGEQICLGVFGLPMTAVQLMARVHSGEAKAVHAEIEAAVNLSKHWGATMVGFAGYTSIVTNNCQSLIEDRVGLTSGNSLTAAAAIEATRQVAATMGIEWDQAHLGIVGGTGNIGRVIAEIEMTHVQSVMLLGRPGAEPRLQRIADSLRQSSCSATIQVNTDLTSLQACNVVISATNAPEPLITSAHLNGHPTVICDVAVPGDVALTVRTQMPNVNVFKGGIVQLPNNQELVIRGMALAKGNAYACIAEVILLGLAGMSEHFSYGPLRTERVKQITVLAKQYGCSFKIRDA